MQQRVERNWGISQVCYREDIFQVRRYDETGGGRNEEKLTWVSGNTNRHNII